MSIWTKLKFLLPSRRRAAERDMQEELAALREMAGAGELGNLTLAAEDARANWTWLWLERLSQDLRYTFRSMGHNKAFTALAVLSLALGIGANSAIYSFMESILLRSLPVPEPESLVVMKWRAKSYASTASSGFSSSTGGHLHRSRRRHDREPVPISGARDVSAQQGCSVERILLRRRGASERHDQWRNGIGPGAVRVGRLLPGHGCIGGRRTPAGST
jgi:hypothetical protein